VWYAQLRAILDAGTAYGDCAIGQGERVNVEFVSANPTGPMHVGHGRARCLATRWLRCSRRPGSRSSASITSMMPAPRSMRSPLAAPALPRGARRENRGDPRGLYPGEYLIEVGRALAERDGKTWLGRPESE